MGKEKRFKFGMVIPGQSELNVNANYDDYDSLIKKTVNVPIFGVTE